jgi:8-oxo-dGTP pyrophosphatase MutT (NUDIX family)
MKLLPRLIHAFARLCWYVLRPLTVGVRVLLIQGDTVVLVKHTYQESWYLPGGGVKKGETLEAALRREVSEEIGAQLGRLALLGIYSNFYEFKSDHIVVFLCHDFTLNGKMDNEIEAVRLFKTTELPADISPGSRRRIGEYLRGDSPPIVGKW